MLAKTVVGRRALNAMIRHIAFHGSVEMPNFYSQRFEHNVVKQLTDDGKVTTARNSYGEYNVVLRGKPSEYTVESVQSPHTVEPLVCHLALSNPRMEGLAKAFRKNHTIPALPEYGQAEYTELLDAID